MREPTQTDPDKYTVVFENDRVRVLEYRDTPAAKTHPRDHGDPDPGTGPVIFGVAVCWQVA